MIVLVRHGQIVSAKGMCIGRTDVPLSDQGRKQAEALAKALRHVQFRRVFSSPAQRAKDTVTPLARQHDASLEFMPEINEIDMGEWDGLSFDHIQARFPEAYAERGNRFGSFRPPGGESFDDVGERAMKTLAELAAGPLPVLAVTHAGVIRSVLCRVTNHPMDDLFRFKLDYARCTVLKPVKDGFELVAENMSPDRVASIF